MNTIEFAFQGVRVRTVLIGVVWWFSAADVCEVLGLGNPAQALTALDEDEKNISSNDVFRGRGRVPWAITESGLYHLIFLSRKPVARPFRRWVTSEVLPSIRRAPAMKPPADDLRCPNGARRISGLRRGVCEGIEFLLRPAAGRRHHGAGAENALA